jgi:hypothetical protein
LLDLEIIKIEVLHAPFLLLNFIYVVFYGTKKFLLSKIRRIFDACKKLCFCKPSKNRS